MEGDFKLATLQSNFLCRILLLLNLCSTLLPIGLILFFDSFMVC